MPDLSRRDWLQGVVTSVIGAQLVIAANARAEGIIVPDTAINLYKPEDMPSPAHGAIGNFVYMCNDKGEYLPVGVLTEMSWDTEVIDVTSFEDGDLRRAYPGTMQGAGRFVFTGGSAVNVAREGMKRVRRPR